MDVSILKSNAEYGKTYLVEMDGLRECKLLGTMGDVTGCYYLLNVAGIGERKVKFQPYRDYPDWWYTSTTKGILYESIEDFRNNRPIIEQYGSTVNAYNSRFVEQLFPNLSVCGCGGGIYTWSWDNNKAVRYMVTGGISWKWDKDGFWYSLSNRDDWYKTKKECEKANENNFTIIKF
jgi:hypothetical protein